MSPENFQFILPPEDDDASEATVDFEVVDIEFTLTDTSVISLWIKSIIEKEQCTLSRLNFIFCNDSYLHQINMDYLEHDTFTDIITFPYAAPPIIQGEIFISIDRIRENSTALKTSFQDELRRVIIHGVLHLCGYGDKKPKEKQLMTQKEDDALRQFPVSGQ
jgi:rRNA maturation RNase YbeY